MMEFILIIGFIILLIWAFSTNIFIGFILLIGILAYYYFKRFASLCHLMALRCYGNGDINGAFRWFERGEKRGMNTSQKITYAYYLMREGRVERSEALLNSVLAFREKDPKIRFTAKSNHAVLMLKTGRLEEALEEFEEIFEVYKTTTVYGSLGYIYILKGDMEKAEAFNLEAYDYNKDDKVILDNLVQLYNKLEKFEEAYKYACELMEKKPTFIEAYYNAAVAEIGVGKTEEAKEHLEHALTVRTCFISAIHHEDVQKLLDSIA
ncbi:MAG: hypothetical protein E7403_06895 [Ruminococcaceae bacterium]|nr:hypothetical protein [Oscillospiraceae bacterium]